MFTLLFHPKIQKMTLLSNWRVVFDQIKEIDVTLKLNNVTDGALTTRIAEVIKLANFIQVSFDDQYFRK